jgi:hypothetical protein
MANREQVKILTKGAKAWNKWRVEKEREVRGIIKPIRPNLQNVKLVEMTLDCVDLSTANLQGATFTGSHFTSAKFGGSDLTMATLRAVDLRGANLRYANLRGTDLRKADLRLAVLFGATLDGADVSDALLATTDLGNIDFRSVKGLETVVHKGPSEIGIATLYRSGGKIPEVFLRGCGVPDNFIAYMRSFMVPPFEFYSCFISYSNRDQQLANRLYADLQNKGVRCWFAPEDLKIGDKLRPSFDEAIRVHDKLLVLLSEHSVNSTWVEKEVETAFENERAQNRIVLFPIRIDDVVMETKQAWAADIRRTRHIGDFCGWKDHDSYMKAFDRLLRDLKTEGRSESVPQT